MNDTLKVAGRIGAELGAARAENERLREALRAIDRRNDNPARFDSEIDKIVRAALSQQAEPECRCTLRERTVGDGCSVCNPELAAELAADIEDDEPAPAQDEREAFEVWETSVRGVAPEFLERDEAFPERYSWASVQAQVAGGLSGSRSQGNLIRRA